MGFAHGSRLPRIVSSEIAILISHLERLTSADEANLQHLMNQGKKTQPNILVRQTDMKEILRRDYLFLNVFRIPEQLHYRVFAVLVISVNLR